MKKSSTAALTAVLAIILITCSKSNATPEEDIISNIESNNKVQINAAQMETELLDLINSHRASQGADPLLSSSEAYPFAEEHNSYMISQSKLSHDNFDSRATAIAARTSASKIGENVARHYTSPQLALQGWLQSSAHKSTLEGNYTHTALSIVLDKEGRPYFTQIFMLLE